MSKTAISVIPLVSQSANCRWS